MAASSFRWKYLTWPNGRIPYLLSANFPYNNFIQYAIDKWSESGLQFIPLNDQNRNSYDYYLTFSYGAGLSHTSIGFQGNKGGQNVTIAPTNDISYLRRTLVHEVGHALGLIHEHQRKERIYFIEVNSANKNQQCPIVTFNEEVALINRTSVSLSGYDLCSIMHYDRFAFSNGRSNTINIVKPSYFKYYNCMGRTEEPSKIDIMGISFMYGLHS